MTALTKAEREFNDIPLRLLIAAMRSVKERIQLKIVQAIADGKPVSSYWVRRSAEIKRLYDEMLEIEQEYLDKNIPAEFKEGQKVARKILTDARIERKARSLFQAAALDAIIADAMELFRTAVEGGLSQVRQLFRATQQRLISELQINQAVAEGLIENNTVTGVKSNLEKALYQKLAIDGKVVTTNTRTGGQRSFDPEYYAEMVARSRTREAQAMGVVSTCLEYGQDLVKVSDHNTTTPICKPHEGKVYSISGSTPGYEKYEGENRVGFHPNCIHVITPYIDRTGLTPSLPPIRIVEQ